MLFFTITQVSTKMVNVLCILSQIFGGRGNKAFIEASTRPFIINFNDFNIDFLHQTSKTSETLAVRDHEIF
mgnify:CR=1 FL=1